MYRVFVIDGDKGVWEQMCETEHEAIEYAEYLNRLHFNFVSVIDEEFEKEILRFEN